ncbi:hypothetical protein FHT72_007103, partial [Rhizobium sp. BK077]|nr:hypothetical protein [Rhizobium sp. BK112]MBB3372562.1 hypothetical protein [Rhizobium sp. BK077]MBB4183334.1 hypothetical protein [Rhizobium sp. BK109]
MPASLILNQPRDFAHSKKKMRARPASCLAFASVLGDEVLDVLRRDELEGN